MHKLRERVYTVLQFSLRYCECFYFVFAVVFIFEHHTHCCFLVTYVVDGWCYVICTRYRFDIFAFAVMVSKIFGNQSNNLSAHTLKRFQFKHMHINIHSHMSLLIHMEGIAHTYIKVFRAPLIKCSHARQRSAYARPR